MFYKGKIRELEIEIARLEQEAEDRRKLPMFDYELVEDTTELLALGAQADGLLKDETFCRAYTELLKDLRVRSAATEPQDTEQREHYYYLIKALQDLLSKINGYAIRAQVRELELNEER